jgi:hypothetical protein
VAMATVALAGCPMPRARSELIEAGANVPLLPSGLPAPEPCPEIARVVMDALKLRTGDSAEVEIDANQFEREPLTIQAGPIESIMLGGMGRLGGASRLYGRVWTSSTGRVVIRYYRAQRALEGNPLPICAVARAGGGQLEGKPGKFAGTAELPYSSATAFVVQDFL